MAISTWPMLWVTPPATETAVSGSLRIRESRLMASMDRIPPAKAYIIALRFPNRKPESETFSAIRIHAVGRSSI